VRELSRLIAAAQSEWRLPSVSAGLLRDGEVVWTEALGIKEPGVPATPDLQYRIGSITKTFCAVAIMQLRDAGELGLDDPLAVHLPDVPQQGPTIRRMLAHTSGLQREPVGEIWETLKPPTRDELLASMAEAEMVLAPGLAFHYSNLAYALLGEVVARRAGRPFEAHADERILRPLGLTRTTWRREEPAARGYFVDPWDDRLLEEADLEPEATQSVGGLWSTVGDLLRWAWFLCDPDPDVLAPASVDEMRSVQVIRDARWRLGHGLGLMLTRRGDRIYAGHGGAMPGYLTALMFSGADRVAAAVLTSTSAVAEPDELAVTLCEKALELEPAVPEPWEPGEAPPDELAGVPGRWWSEGEEFVFRFRKGRLEAKLPRSVLPPGVFERVEADVYRTVSGRERGELLRLVRDEGGAVVKMYWATYPFTRTPQVFGRPPADSGAQR
jgi:CubicO group peptidase (beta-lactamase class C family)